MFTPDQSAIRNPQSAIPRHALLIIFLLLLCYFCFFYGLGRLPFVGADEARYCRVAEEMLASGQYVIPRLRGRPWLEKPPLAYWLMAATFKLFGSGEWQARFPSALLALLTVVAVYWTARILLDAMAGFLSAMTLTTMTGFFVFARAASTDMPLTATLTIGLCSWLLSQQAQRSFGADRQSALVVASGFFFGLAVLAKGLIGVIFPVAIIAATTLLARRLRLGFLELATALAVFLAVALPWHWLAYRQGGFDFVATYFINHHLARYLTELHHHARPFYFYVPVLGLLALPWTGFLPSLSGRNAAGAEKPAVTGYTRTLLLIWILLPFLFFSFSSTKLIGYMLPLLPPVALWLGLVLRRRTQGSNTPALYFYVTATILCVVSVAAVYAAARFYGAAWSVAPAGLLLAAGAAALLYLWRRQRVLAALLSLAFFLSLSAAALVEWFVPVLAVHHSTRSVVQHALPLLALDQSLLLYRYFHHTAFYYSGFRVAEDKLDNVRQLQAYLAGHPAGRWIVLTTREGAGELASLSGYRVSQVRAEGNLVLMTIDE